MKTLTPNELENLPFCKFDIFGKCMWATRAKDVKYCTMCALDDILMSLRHGDIASATHTHATLVKILEHQKLLPEVKRDDAEQQTN